MVYCWVKPKVGREIKILKAENIDKKYLSRQNKKHCLPTFASNVWINSSGTDNQKQICLKVEKKISIWKPPLRTHIGKNQLQEVILVKVSINWSIEF